jgi:protocatechuate 3,4-dioxygenase beta subunit
VAVPKGFSDGYLVARAEGWGVDFLNLREARKAAEVGLRLVKDHAVRGRVLDTQGKPVAGVRVAVRGISVYPNDSLDSMLAEWKKRHPRAAVPSGVKGLRAPQGLPFAVATTDAQGRFTLRGAGAERLLFVRLGGAGVADAAYWVANRDGLDPGPYNAAVRRNVPDGFAGFSPAWVLHGPELSLVAEAEKPIRGVVTAADTGKGRPGVEVSLMRSGDGLTHLPVALKATTDAAGRYEIRGARKASSYPLEVADDEGAGYMPCQVRAADTPGYEPVAADFRVAKGVIVTGRVLDKSTGKGVPGVVLVSVLHDNPFAKDYPTFNSPTWLPLRDTADDGSYRLVTIPGPVILMGGPDGRRFPGGGDPRYRYKQPAADPKYPQYFPHYPVGVDCLAYGATGMMIQGNWCKVLDIKPGTAVVEQDILLEPASTFAVFLRDPADKPLTGVVAAGTTAREWFSAVPCATDTCTVYELESASPRLLVFYEPVRKLAAAVTLRRDERPPVTVTLRPAGAVKGRLVGGDGKPLAGVAVELRYKDRPAEEASKGAGKGADPPGQVVTGPDGTFVVDPVLPGLPFELAATRQTKRLTLTAKPAAALTVVSRETKDLGDLTVKPQADGPGG